MYANVFADAAVIRATREPYLKSFENLLKNLEKTG